MPEYKGGLPVSSQQRAVVEHVASHRVTVVGAGAGSGKSHTLIATVLDLIQNSQPGSSPVASIEQFILITFTREAANDLREDIEAKIRANLEGAREPATGNHADANLWAGQLELLSSAFIGTIHSFSRMLLREYGYAEEVARESDVYTAKTLRTKSFREALNRYVTSRSAPTLFGQGAQLSQWEVLRLLEEIYNEVRNRGYSTEQLLTWTRNQPDDARKAYRVAVARLVHEGNLLYAADKARLHRLDTHDLLEKARVLLQGEGEVPARLCRRYHYLFIDEFQDTDQVQKDMLEALLEQTSPDELRKVLVVGDPKQSIYIFRGAEVHLLKEMAKRYMYDNNQKALPLNVSRRSTLPCLRAQNALFRSMQQRFPDLDDLLEAHPESHVPRTPMAPFRYYSADDQPSRIGKTAEVIRGLLGQLIDIRKEGIRPIREKDIVVLVRTNELRKAYVEGLNGLGIHAVDVADRSFYARPEIIATYRMLRLLLRYPDSLALEMALETPYLNGVAIDEFRSYLIQHPPQQSYPLADILRSRFSDQQRRLDAVRAAVRSETVPQLLKRLYEEYRIVDWYALHDPDGQTAGQNLERLRSIARSIMNNERALTLQSFVRWLEIAILTGREEKSVDGGDPVAAESEGANTGIRVMTVHHSKGDEFPIVIIPEVQKDLKQQMIDPDFLVVEGHGLEINNADCTPPSAAYQKLLSARREQHLGEKMRIFYVAVTRASHAVITIGGGRRTPNALATSDYYSWKDEILQARGGLESERGDFSW